MRPRELIFSSCFCHQFILLRFSSFPSTVVGKIHLISKGKKGPLWVKRIQKGFSNTRLDCRRKMWKHLANSDIWLIHNILAVCPTVPSALPTTVSSRDSGGGIGGMCGWQKPVGKSCPQNSPWVFLEPNLEPVWSIRCMRAKAFPGPGHSPSEFVLSPLRWAPRQRQCLRQRRGDVLPQTQLYWVSDQWWLTANSQQNAPWLWAGRTSRRQNLACRQFPTPYKPKP